MARQAMTTMMIATSKDNDNNDGDGATGNEVDDDGNGVMGNGTTGYNDAKPKYYLCSRCKGCFIFMSV